MRPAPGPAGKVAGMKYANSVLDLIGNTPLVKLSKVTDGVRPTVLAKLEYLNPSGSVKARIAKYMVERAEEDLLRRMDQAISLDDLGHPSIIAGIEVYRSASQVPVQFGGTSVDTLCGVIVIWTHTGRMRAGERS